MDGIPTRGSGMPINRGSNAQPQPQDNNRIKEFESIMQSMHSTLGVLNNKILVLKNVMLNSGLVSKSDFEVEENRLKKLRGELLRVTSTVLPTPLENLNFRVEFYKTWNSQNPDMRASIVELGIKELINNPSIGWDNGQKIEYIKQHGLDELLTLKV